MTTIHSPRYVISRLAACFVRSCLLVLAFGLLTDEAIAQSANQGSISGRVFNNNNARYVGNAKINVEGTGLEVVSDDFGFFELRNVPAGSAKLAVTYAGEAPQNLTVVVLAGKTTVQDVTLGRPAATGSERSVVLSVFEVAADRFKNAREIAINEERQSVNIKNVISTDQFGDIPSNNVGELVKFLPGVQVSYGAYNGNNQGYSDSDASGVSIRGFGAEDTSILIDGLPVANAAPGSLTRQVGLDQLSINNASRVELIKVATPDMPNNSIGGQINLISRSAFEQARPSYAARVFFNFNSKELPKSSKTPGPVNQHTYKTTPGVEFSATVPFSSKLGVSLTASAADEYNSSQRAESTYTTFSAVTNAAGKPLTIDHPGLTRFRVTDITRLTEKRSSNLRFDWKPTPTQTLKASVQYSTYSGAEGQRRLDARPTVAAGADWNANQFIGTTANSTMDMTVTTRDVEGSTKSGQLQYFFVRNGWTASASGSISDALTTFEDRNNGHFSEVSFKLNPGQVKLLNIVDGNPRVIETSRRVANGVGILDYTKFSNFTPDAVVAKSGESSSRKQNALYKFDIERDLSFLSFLGSNSLSVKIGGRRDEERSEKFGLGANYNQDLIAGATFPIIDVYDDTYLGASPGYNLPAQEWGSTYKLFALNQAKTIFEVPADGSTAVNNHNSFVGQQIDLTETRDALYGQLSGRFLNNRLYFVGGLRQESVSRKGRGPYRDPKWNYVKNKDGTLYKDPANPLGVRLDQATSPLFTPAGAALRSSLNAAGISFPNQAMGATATSLASAKLFNRPNVPVDAEQTGKPSLSLSTVYKVTPKIDVKLAWSRSFGLPALENGTAGLVSSSGQFQINENVPIAADGTVGTITVANPNLKPQTANSWDGEVSYYTDKGGKLSAAYYIKDVTDQITSYSTYSGTPGFDEVVSALGLDPASYDGWILRTSSNSTTSQRTSGWEFSASQDFAFLGSFGKRFSAFASFAFKNLADPSAPAPVNITTPSGGVISVAPTVSTITKSSNRFGGAGLQFSGGKLSVQIRGTYRDENEIARSNLAAVNGSPNFLRRFAPAQTNIDLTANYTLSKRYSLFLSGRDIFNGARAQINRDDLGLLPHYGQPFDRREFGVVWTFGVNGRF